MNFLLFAADEVGLETANVFRKHDQAVAALVLDRSDRKGLNDRICATTGVTASQIIYSDELETAARLASLAAMEIDLAILAWWPYILRQPLIALPRLGCLNFHPSYLPYNRGKDPNFWSLKDQTPCGVTIHFVDAGVDTGDIAFQSRIETSWEDTGATLYAKANREIVELFDRCFPQIQQGDIPRNPQPEYGVRQHKRSQLEPASQIDLDATYRGRDLLNLLRARTFPPHPGAWFLDSGERYEINVSITRVDRK